MDWYYFKPSCVFTTFLLIQVLSNNYGIIHSITKVISKKNIFFKGPLGLINLL